MREKILKDLTHKNNTVKLNLLYRHAEHLSHPLQMHQHTMNSVTYHIHIYTKLTYQTFSYCITTTTTDVASNYPQQQCAVLTTTY